MKMTKNESSIRYKYNNNDNNSKSHIENLSSMENLNPCNRFLPKSRNF